MRPRPSIALLTLLAASPLGACRCRPEAPPPPPDAPREAGERVQVPGAAVSLLVPDGWTREIEGDVLSLIGPGERVVLTVMAVDAADLESSLATLDRELGRMVRGAELRELQEREIDGMRALLGDGRGRLGGDAVDLEVMLVRGPDARIVIIFGVALAGADDGAVEVILGSLRRAG